jgi:hypothetical protein
MSMLIQQALGVWPREASAAALLLALGGIVVGAFLWLAGAKFSQSLIALVAVAVGAFIGLNLPRWLDWPVAGWASAVGLALTLGVCGYAMHRLWAGAALSLLLATWAGIGAVCGYGLTETVRAAWAAVSPQLGLVDRVQNFWNALPADLHRALPFACGVAFAAGLGLMLMWVRLATVLFYSVLGVSMLVGFGSIAVLMRRPSLMNMVPASPTVRWSVLGGLVILGMLVQLRLFSRPASSPPAKDGKGSDV